MRFIFLPPIISLFSIQLIVIKNSIEKDNLKYKEAAYSINAPKTGFGEHFFIQQSGHHLE